MSVVFSSDKEILNDNKMITKQRHDRALVAAAFWLDKKTYSTHVVYAEHERITKNALLLAQYVRDIELVMRALTEHVIDHHGNGTTAESWGTVCPKCKNNKFWQKIKKIWGDDESQSVKKKTQDGLAGDR